MSSDVLRIGRVIQISGSSVIGELESSVEDLYRTFESRRYAVGQVGSIVKIHAGDRLVFGVVIALRMVEHVMDEKALMPSVPVNPNTKWLEIELFGEATRTGNREVDFDFQRGVITYPLPGQAIFVASVAELEQIYQKPDKPSVPVGTLSQASSLPVHLLTDELLGKHFAVLGTTGAGKSCSVTVLLRSILEVAPHAHMVLLDPHGEYNQAFQDKSELIDPTMLNLPHWLLNFEESAGLFIGRTEFAATSQTNILKDSLLKVRRDPNSIDTDQITVDTPVPYKISDLISEIDCEMEKITAMSKRDPFLKIKNKIETLQADKRFSFLIRPDDTVSDDLNDIVCQYLRIPVSEKPISIIDLSGVPSDVVNVVVSVLCRMIFNFAVWGNRPVKVPIVLVCEEAHRYAPRGEHAAHSQTKRALARIAKEGRKYGVGLGLISQRPSELDESILSQCNTLIALRMSNEMDQNYVKRALPDGIQSIVNILPTLRTQEALVVGEGTVVPTRLRFNDLASEHQPNSSDASFTECWTKDDANGEYVKKVIRRWRLQERPD